MELPAHCPRCNFLFPFGMSAAVGAHLDVTGCAALCPACGGHATVPEGVMEIIDDAIRLVSGPDFTKDLFEAIGIAVEDVRHGRASPKEAASRIARISPAAGDQFYKWSMWGMAFIGMMFTILTYLDSHKAQPHSNMSAEEVVESAAEDFYRSQPRPVRNATARQPPVKVAPHDRSANVNANGHSPQKNRHQRRVETAAKRRKLKPRPSWLP